ncbi:MAG: plasmid pRiA4b ORF-3 family protein [Kofleriaceae bacterium]|nr:plasmid pRiA4b ORF-3 family protein [Kofleriaceae bacterium]
MKKVFAGYELRVELVGSEPLIWRALEVPAEYTLYELHGAIQIAMGWENCHLHSFTIDKTRFEMTSHETIGGAPSLDETAVALGELLGPSSEFGYEYDFGDSWHHRIAVTKMLTSSTPVLPRCTAGERACPLEDSGGIHGYEAKLQIMLDKKHEDYLDLKEWMPPKFDPSKFKAKGEDMSKAMRQLFKMAGAPHNATPAQVQFIKRIGSDGAAKSPTKAKATTKVNRATTDAFDPQDQYLAEVSAAHPLIPRDLLYTVFELPVIVRIQLLAFLANDIAGDFSRVALNETARQAKRCR